MLFVQIISAIATSTTGKCGPIEGNLIRACATGFCCSSAGYCGTSPQYCEVGCQHAFGTCSPNASPGPKEVGGCGPNNNNVKCASGYCCSSAGFCGTTTDYCGVGCNSAFGICN